MEKFMARFFGAGGQVASLTIKAKTLRGAKCKATHLAQERYTKVLIFLHDDKPTTSEPWGKLLAIHVANTPSFGFWFGWQRWQNQ